MQHDDEQLSVAWSLSTKRHAMAKISQLTGTTIFAASTVLRRPLKTFNYAKPPGVWARSELVTGDASTVT
jgi:hypothetical protein